MEEQIPPSQPPMPQAPEGQITPEMLAQMKARARELAVQQAMAQASAQVQQPPQVQPQVVYVRRNLTVAEILVVLLVSCGIVTGVQWSWNMVTNVLPRVEIRMR